MVKRKVRRTDAEDSNGWKQRSWINPKEVALIISFLLGGGLGNVGMQKITGTDTTAQIETINPRVQALELNFNNYKESQFNEQVLRDSHLETKLEAIHQEIIDCKELLQNHTNK